MKKEIKELNFKNVNSAPENIKLSKGTYTLTLGLNEPSKIKKTTEKNLQLIIDGEIKNIRINSQKYELRTGKYIVNFTILQNPIILSVVIYGIVASGVFGTGAWFFSEINKTGSYLTLALIGIGIFVVMKYSKKLGLK